MNEVPNTFGSLFIGYTFIWGVLAAYIFYLRGKINTGLKRQDRANNN